MRCWLWILCVNLASGFANALSVSGSRVGVKMSKRSTTTSKGLSTFSQLMASGAVYWGVALDNTKQTPQQYSTAIQNTAPVYNIFINMTLGAFSASPLINQLTEIKSLGAAVMLTVQPFQGLAAITNAEIAGLADLCKNVNSLGLLVFLRWGHEMNGYWYPWGDSPIAYQIMFRRVSLAVKAAAKKTVLVWAPNAGAGYPYGTSGQYLPKKGDPRFKEMDTNGDGVLNSKDDPYTPYYPGDAYVDWIGVSMYDKRTESQSTTLANVQSDRPTILSYLGSSTFNLYTTFVQAKKKPFLIAETAAAYYPSYPAGSGELVIKETWWKQFWAASTLQRYPLLKIVLWFEFIKPNAEGEVQDYRITASSTVLKSFIADVKSSGKKVRFLGDALAA